MKRILRRCSRCPDDAVAALAFTVVELLVVVAIISVLLAILLPALSAPREQARIVVCASNVRTIGQACFLYANDNAFPPDALGGNGTTSVPEPASLGAVMFAAGSILGRRRSPSDSAP